MKIFLFLILFGLTGTIQAQGECLISYISDHYVLNNTNKVVTIWVNNRNQESFPTEGPQKFQITPGASVKVSDLEWAEEFRDPTLWYVFKIETAGLTRLCDKKNWKFHKVSETHGKYTLTLEPTNKEPCPPLDEERYFTNPIYEEDLTEKIHQFPEQEARFPGGPTAMYKWITQNIQTPEQAQKDTISGKVFVEFVVEKSGELSNIKILRSPHELLSNETIRLVENMPKWEPALVSNQPVRSLYRLPFVFRLD
jgi:TonB family protein